MTDARENLLRNLLQKIAAEQKYDDPDIKTAAVPTTGANFSSQLFNATIRSTGKEDLNVFAKVAVMGETIRKQTGIDMFDIEKHFYTKLAKTYKEIEDKHNIPEKHRLIVPKFYGNSDEYLKEVLVLQDMSRDGFVTYDRLKSVDWDYASKATEEMAKLHALSMAYHKEYPEEYEVMKKISSRKMMEENDAMIEMYKKTIEQVTQMAREENKPKLRQFFSETFNPQTLMSFCLPKKRPVITHADYRQSNLMHKIDKDGNLQIVIVDYQTMHPGSFPTDLLYFIFIGSDGAFRAQYYDQLVEHYYENLAAALRRLNLDPEEAFPRADFDEELKEMLPYGLIVASMMLPMTTVDLANVTKTLGNEFERENFDTTADLMSNTNALCARRFNEVVDDYVKWGVL